MSDVKQKILDAIELLATNSVQKAGYDKTIQAQIVSCADAAIGKYKCKYQDSVFYAYVTNPDIALSKGTSVYILVPENDMRKNKTIIGTVDKLGVDYVSSAIGEQAYNIIGTNCIISSDNITYYLDIDKKDYSFKIFQADSMSYITEIDEAALQKYLKQSSSLLIGATIKTTIPPEKQFEGHYGITYGLSFINPEDNTIVIRDYTIDEDNMIDNPYRLAYPTRQYAIFDIDGANFNRLEYITLFCKDFINAVDDPPEPLTYEIELSKLELTGAVKMSEEQLNGSVINFYTPRGTFFQTGATNNDYKTITAQVKIKGRLVSSSENIEFYWGRQDVSVVSDSQYYNRYLGRGWKCLNSYNSIDLNTTPTSIQWVPYQDTYIFNYQQATARNNKIKVAAVYDGSVLTKQINIEDFNKDANFIQIISEFGKNFYYGVGKTNLTCRVNPPQGTTYNNLSYYWAWQNYGGVWETLDSNGNLVENLFVNKIFNFATFKCTVYNNNALLGTASIILTNSTQGQGFSSLLINNGSVVFKYDENGVSPAARNNESPQQIYPLSFTLYDETGTSIDSSNPYNCIIKWGIPIIDTMLVDKNNVQFIQTDGEYNYYSSQTLVYDIASRYEVSKVNNQVKLSVSYKGITYFAETNFTFTKEGNVGTNGTEYVVKLVPNTLMTNPPEFPMLTKVESGDVILNYGLNSAQQEFPLNGPQQLLKAQLWHNGELVWEGFSTSGTSYDGNITVPTAVEWSVLANKYNSSTTDDSDFVVTNASDGTLQYTYSLTNLANPTANIIKCAITYNNKIYYGTIPITTAWVTNNNYRVKLKKNSGFRYVLYAADEMNPEYSNVYPFEFLCYNNGTDISLDSSTTYTASTIGQVKSMIAGGAATNVNLFIALDSSYYREGLNKNQFKYKPSPRYDGACVNASVNCSYKINGTEIARLRVPVHFLLNKYGLSNLNAWDGNSIQIDDEGGFILAPQMGAGVKNNDNSFTGVLMGEVRNAGKSGADIGLLGYNSGNRTFFLNSENGSAIFGNKTTSQIIIDPASDNARLYSGDFWKATNYDAQTGLPNSYLQSQYNDAGMLIDLTTPKIIFKNRMFEIDQNGSIKANRIPQYQTGHQGQAGRQKKDSNGYIIYENLWNFNVNAQTGLIQSGYDINNQQYNFTVDGTTGNVTLTGAITATSGYIGSGLKSWTIGGTTPEDEDGGAPSRAWIYSGAKRSLTATAQGIYFGTDGISIYKGDNQKALEIDFSNHTAYFDIGTITLSKDTVVTWGNQSPKVEDLITDIINGNNQRTYITGTFIDGTTIKAPIIYGGYFYATGDGNKNQAAYYIYNGTPSLNVNKVGYISYDDSSGREEADPDGQNPKPRVVFRTLGETVLKLQSAGNLSIETGAWNENSNKPTNLYTVYLMSDSHFDKNIFLSSTDKYKADLQREPYVYFYWYGGCWGNETPDNDDNHWDNAKIGTIYFALDE